MADYIGEHDFSGATVSGITGITPFECTVGASGADYTTLGAAITAGKTRILVIDDTTETGNITLPSNCIIKGIGMNNVNINMSTYKFDDNAEANSYFTFENLKITHAYLTPTNLFDTFNFLTLRDIYIDNNSGTNVCWSIYYTGSADFKITMENVTLDLPNYYQCGMYLNGEVGTINNLTIIGGGANCRIALDISDDVTITNLYMKGTFVNGGASSYDVKVKGGSIINNIYCATGVTFHTDNAKISNLTNISGKLYATECSITNFRISELNYEYQSKFANGKITSAYTTASRLAQFNNITFVGAVTIQSGDDDSIYTGCYFDSSVSVTGDDITFSGCRVGADAGGGSNTITINSGANRTIITGCRTDAAIVDNGTDTATGTNVVY